MNLNNTNCLNVYDKKKFNILICNKLNILKLKIKKLIKDRILKEDYSLPGLYYDINIIFEKTLDDFKEYNTENILEINDIFNNLNNIDFFNLEDNNNDYNKEDKQLEETENIITYINNNLSDTSSDMSTADISD
jgi:hypothetical protein